MLEVKRLDLPTFLREVVPFLVAREVENNLLLGVVLEHAKRAEPARDAVWLAIEEDGAVVAAAARIPPQHVVVSRLPPDAARGVADCFIDLGAVPDGASGPDDHGRDVLTALRQRLGGRVHIHSAETIYELYRVADIELPQGAARTVGANELGLLTSYIDAFIREVKLPRGADAARIAERHVAAGSALFWDDGRPCALACTARRTPTGSAIAPVYTPPEARRHGYGAAVTAALARQRLDAGDRFVCLFAERKNPTANHVYQRVGFRAIGDFNVWSLG